MSERIPTDVLVEAVRDRAAELGDDWGHDVPEVIELHRAADRLAELAALEPVGELLAVMRRPAGATLTVDAFGHSGSASLLTRRFDERPRLVPACFEMAHGDSPEAALAALAEQVRGRA